MEFDDLSSRVIGCVSEVHRHLAQGLLESVYEQCLAHELSRNKIAFQLQLAQAHWEATILELPADPRWGATPGARYLLL